MSDTKRSYSQVAGETPQPEEKKHLKPGRKPIETEPKSKRTAQNRAAQRAYRERKERKMKELEEKVAHLEDVNVKAATETDLLKAQIDLLKKELARHRGHLDFLDLELPTLVPPIKESVVAPKTTLQLQGLVMVDFPWLKRNIETQVPDLVSSSSSLTLPNEQLGALPDNDAVKLRLEPLNQFNIFSNFDEQVEPFCVKLNEACGTKQLPVPKLRREVPPAPPADYTLSQRDSYGDSLGQSALPDPSLFATLFTPTDGNDPFLGLEGYKFALGDDLSNDPLLFLNDTNFHVPLAFNSAPEPDPLAGLTLEELAYDPFGGKVNTMFNFNEFVKGSLSSHTSSRALTSDVHRSALLVTSLGESPYAKPDEEVVPAPEMTVKCLEIWDRITLHPRYTEIDIDGLCAELKSKAKCLEKGVVLKAKDVSRILEKTAIRR